MPKAGGARAKSPSPASLSLSTASSPLPSTSTPIDRQAKEDDARNTQHTTMKKLSSKRLSARPEPHVRLPPPPSNKHGPLTTNSRARALRKQKINKPKGAQWRGASHCRFLFPALSLFLRRARGRDSTERVRCRSDAPFSCRRDGRCDATLFGLCALYIVSRDSPFAHGAAAKSNESDARLLLKRPATGQRERHDAVKGRC